MSSTGSNLINAIGAGRFNVAQTVDGLIEADKAAPQERIDTKKESYETQLSALGVLRSSISTFQSIVNPLSSPDTFNARSLSFPDNSDYIRPESIDPGAQLGSYQLHVEQVAQSQALSSGLLDKDANLGEGKFKINFVEPAAMEVSSGKLESVGEERREATNGQSMMLFINGIEIPLQVQDDPQITARYTKSSEHAVEQINAYAGQTGVTARKDPSNFSQLIIESVDGEPFEIGYRNDEGAGGAAGKSLPTHFGIANITQTEKYQLNDELDAVEIEIKDGETVEDLVEKINKQAGDVQASLLDVAGGTQLVLTSPSGLSRQIEIETTGSSKLEQFRFDHDTPNASSMKLTQEGRDAKLSVNGVKITRNENKLDDVIPGLTFTLDKAMEKSDDKVTFTVTEDKSTAKQAIQNFVEGYNALMATFTNLTGVKTADPEEGIEENQVGVLSRDSTAKGLLSSVKSVLSSAAGADSQQIFLAELGIRTKLDGTLEIKDTQGKDGKTDLDRMIDESFDRVQALFSQDMSTSTPFIDIETSSSIGNLKSGTHDIEITQEPERAKTTLKAFDGWNLDTAAGSSSATAGSGDSTAFKLEIGNGSSNENKLSTASINIKDVIADNAVTTDQEFAAALEKTINNDEAFKKDDIKIKVEIVDNAGKKELVFTSETYGDNRQISFGAVVDPNNKFGLSDAANVETTDGKDVAGKINGEEAFGAGNLLLPALSGNHTGVRFEIQEGSLGKHTFTFERGLAGDMDALLAQATTQTSVVSGPSIIGQREATLNERLKGLESDQESLDERLEKARERYTREYSLLDSIMRNFSRSQDTLTNLLNSWQAAQNQR